MTAPRPVGGRTDLFSELALLGVSLAVVGGFARLYEHGAALGDLVVVVVAAHVLAALGRRVPAPPWAVAAAAVVAGATLVAWLLFPDTLASGAPTGATWHQAAEAFHEAGRQFRTVAAPTEAIVGFQLTAAVALWGAAWFADWAAFRLGATAEAVAPAAVIFVFCSILGSGQHRLAAALGFCAAVLLFAAAHRSRRASAERAWLAPRPAAARRAVLRSGLALGVVALAVGAAAGPRVPGAGSDPLVHWRARGLSGGQRTTISPIVDLRKRLVTQTDAEMFRVETNRPAYWRLTALEEFDGQIWSSGGEFTVAGSDLPDVDRAVAPAREIRQVVRVSALSAIWAPVAFEARSLRSSTTGLRWDASSSTLIVDASAATSDGTVYEVVSEAPVLDPAVLRAARAPDPARIAVDQLSLPAAFPGRASMLAREVTRDFPTRYDKARALQDWFRQNFTYSLDVPAGHSDDAIAAFLDSRAGYCEQFAGTYAAMARSIGIPARVAVGFTPGEPDPDRPDVYVVRGRHAHAWPEVYFAGVGWVPFEPTPGRGIPDAQSYTGAAPEQDDRPVTAAPSSTTTTSTTVPPSGTTPGGTVPDLPRNRTVAGAPGADEAGGRSPWLTFVVAGLALVLVWFVLVLAAPTIRRLVHRERHHGGTRRAVADAWHDTLAPVRWLTDRSPRESETHREFAERAAPVLGELAEPFRELAALATRAAWDPHGPSHEDLARARELAARIRHEALSRQSPGDRARRRLDWREAFEKV